MIQPQWRPPNVDVALEYQSNRELDWVGIESKFREPYPASRHRLIDHKYLAQSVLWDGLPETRRLAGSICGEDSGKEREKSHLYRGQLIKHLLGMRRNRVDNKKDARRVMLVYLWYEVPSDESDAHQREINDFGSILCKDNVLFKAMTWQDLIEKLALRSGDDHGDYHKYLKERYVDSMAAAGYSR